MECNVDIHEATAAQTCVFPQHIQAIACDLDMTLALSRQPVEQSMAQVLCELSWHMPLAIVSGGAFHLFEYQLTPYVDARANREQIYLLPTSGARRYEFINDAWQCVQAHDLGDEDKRMAIASLTKRAHELGLWLDDSMVQGDRIEDRGGQITFSALGQLASRARREAWDPQRVKKNALARLVAQDLPHLTVKTGGSTSVDVIAPGINKGFAVRLLAELWHIDVSSIAFFGDRMQKDGNDWPAAQEGAYAIHVNNPDETYTVLSAWAQTLAQRKLCQS